MTAFEVRRDDLRQTRFVDEPEGNVRVERFALTANNVTYGVMGDAMSYWEFFPASEEGWGRIPVWGVGTVVETGATVYGYFPLASSATLQLGEDGVERSPHRQELAAIYNQYLPIDPDDERTDATLLLRPLFGTSFLLEDFLAGSEGTIVLGSASSKTAYGLAFLLARGNQPVIGLTSERNREFTESLRVYDRVLTYDEVAALAREPVVFVDMSGDGAVRDAVHDTAEVQRSIAVGATHWEELEGGFGDDRAEVFFAPSHIEAMAERLGGAELQRRMGAAWQAFMDSVDTFMEVERGSGPEDVERVWRALVDGDADPSRGHVLTLR